MSGEFDWVKAHSECTLEKVFDRLSDAVKHDLERHHALNPGMAQCQTFGVCEDGGFYVERSDVHRVVFNIERRRIHIDRWAYHGDRTPLMVLTVRLDDDGKCVLVDDNKKAWKPWQVRRKALEDVVRERLRLRGTMSTETIYKGNSGTWR